MDWNSEITKDGNTIEPGIYKYLITEINKTESKGTGKLPPSPMLVVKAKIDLGNFNERTITDYIVLHESLEWKVSQFLVSIGQKEKGKPCKPDWSNAAIVGKRGLLETRNQKGIDGRIYARVLQWIPQAEYEKRKAENQDSDFLGDFEPINDDRIPF